MNKGLEAILTPLSMGYTWLMQGRRFFLKRNAEYVRVPVWVVGHLTLGGVGKTPLVAAIAQHFVKRGLKVGMVSRGYRARCHQFPHEVQASDTADWVGDEPLMLKQQTHCPVVIAPKRMEAVHALMARYPLDLILSDDGLQHERMGRALEMVVVDGVKGFGNHKTLPAGPLREGIKRLQSVDMLIVNGETKHDLRQYHPYTMCYKIQALLDLKTGQQYPIDLLKGKQVNVVTGIGDPNRFIRALEGLGIAVKPFIFPDHYRFTEADFAAILPPIVMTEKDAVKCQPFAKAGWYTVKAALQLEDAFWHRLEERLLCKND